MIGDVIKKIRMEHKLTQKDLADLLFVSDKTISSWENDRTVPDIYMLEKISKMYHIQMNDLMSGEVTWFSKVKYQSKKIIYLILSYVKTHVFLSLLIFCSIVSFILILTLPPLTSYIIMNVVILSSVILLIAMYSKWLIALFFLSLPLLIQDLILIINPTYYRELIDSPSLLMVEGIILFSLIGILIVMLIYAVSLFIKKHPMRFQHLLSIGVIMMWMFIVILYDKTYSLSYRYSSFTDRSTYHIQKNEYFMIYTLSYHFIISGISYLLYKIKRITQTKSIL